MMNKVKRILLLLLCVGFTMAMSACSAPDSTGAETETTGNVETTSQGTPETTGTVATKNMMVGINQFAPHPSLDNCREGFIEGLRQAGHADITIDYQNAQADMTTANTISSNFVSKKYDLICGIATPSAQTAFNAALGKNIPVVFSAVSDPVSAQIVQSLEEPGTGATGTSDTLPIDAQLKMIRAFLPEAKNIGILFTTSEVNSASQIAAFETLAPQYGFTIVTKGINTGTDISLAVDALLPEVDCITNLTDNTVVTNLATIVEKANAKNIPVFGSEEEQLKSGCAASQTLDYFALGIETGKIAAKILNGEEPAHIPVSIISDSKPVINRAACEKLGIAVPEEYAQAENVE